MRGALLQKPTSTAIVLAQRTRSSFLDGRQIMQIASLLMPNQSSTKLVSMQSALPQKFLAVQRPASLKPQKKLAQPSVKHQRLNLRASATQQNFVHRSTAKLKKPGLLPPNFLKKQLRHALN